MVTARPHKPHDALIENVGLKETLYKREKSNFVNQSSSLQSLNLCRLSVTGDQVERPTLHSPSPYAAYRRRPKARLAEAVVVSRSGS